MIALGLQIAKIGRENNSSMLSPRPGETMLQSNWLKSTCLTLGLCLGLGGAPGGAQAEASQCGPRWHAQANEFAKLGLHLLRSEKAADRVWLWRMLELGEDVPSTRRSSRQSGIWRFPDPFWGYRPDGYYEEDSRLEKKRVEEAREFLMREAAGLGLDWEKGMGEQSLLPENFASAAKQFTERKEMLGPAHPYLKQWLRNQISVFRGQSTSLLYVANQFKGVAAELAADDYRYQYAVALMYGGGNDAAIESFGQIAKNTKSRHRATAAFMMARSFTRAQKPGEALSVLAKISSDPDLANVRANSARLLGSIAWNLSLESDDIGTAVETNRRLLLENAWALRSPSDLLGADPAMRTLFRQGIDDLRYFLRSDQSRDWMRVRIEEDWWIDPSVPTFAHRYLGAFSRAAREDDLLDWLQATEQVRDLANGPWMAFLSDRTISAPFRNASEHVERRARETGKLTWILAHVMRATHDIGIAGGAFNAIKGKSANCSASPAEQLAHGVLGYHFARLETMRAGERYQDVALDQSVIPHMYAWPPRARVESTRFLLAATGLRASYPIPEARNADLKRLLSGTLDEFVAIPNSYDSGDGFWAVVNMLPILLQLDLVRDERLQEATRAGIVRNVWTKAFLLRDKQVLKDATNLLGLLNPALKGMIDDYRSKWTDAGRRRAGLLLLLKTPSMKVQVPAQRYLADLGNSPARAGYWSWFLAKAESTEKNINLFWADRWNPNDGNWWCRMDPIRLQTKLQQDFYDRPLVLSPAGWQNYWKMFYREWRIYPLYSQQLMKEIENARTRFLTQHPVLRLIDWEELGALSKIPAAPKYLTEKVIAWVEDANWLERWWYEDEMAEALALSVRVTRYGCRRDGPNGAYSKAAFQLLHRYFPDSEAAKHTKYWYN